MSLYWLHLGCGLIHSVYFKEKKCNGDKRCWKSQVVLPCLEKPTRFCGLNAGSTQSWCTSDIYLYFHSDADDSQSRLCDDVVQRRPKFCFFCILFSPFSLSLSRPTNQAWGGIRNVWLLLWHSSPSFFSYSQPKVRLVPDYHFWCNSYYCNKASFHFHWLSWMIKMGGTFFKSSSPHFRLLVLTSQLR